VVLAVSNEGSLALELRRAGVLTHPERLRDLAKSAWKQHGADHEGGLRRKVIADRLRGELTWHLLEMWRPAVLGEVVGWLLERYEPEGVTHPAVEAAVASYTPSSPAMRVIKLRAKARHDEAVLTKAVVKRGLLDTMLVFGKPIGDCLVSEVKTWADVRETEMHEAGRDVRFARSLVSNLANGERVRDWWGGPREAEVEAIYASAATIKLIEAPTEQLRISDH
jgi:coenzyme F420-reducing hydrogenase delta subunit